MSSAPLSIRKTPLVIHGIRIPEWLESWEEVPDDVCRQVLRSSIMSRVTHMNCPAPILALADKLLTPLPNETQLQTLTHEELVAKIQSLL